MSIRSLSVAQETGRRLLRPRCSAEPQPQVATAAANDPLVRFVPENLIATVAAVFDLTLASLHDS